MPKWLSRLFNTTNNLSAITALLTTSWGAVMAIIVGVAAYISGYASSIVHNHEVRDASTIAMFFLWAWVGIRLSYQSTSPLLVKQSIRLEHGLSFEGMAYADNHNPAKDIAMQIGVNFRNYSGVALIYEVERFDVRIKTRHISSEGNSDRGGLIPFGAARCYWAPAYPRSEIKDFLQQDAEAIVDLSVVYKPFNENRKRRMKMKFGIGLIFNESGLIGASDRILSQTEEEA